MPYILEHFFVFQLFSESFLFLDVCGGAVVYWMQKMKGCRMTNHFLRHKNFWWRWMWWKTDESDILENRKPKWLHVFISRFHQSWAALIMVALFAYHFISLYLQNVIHLLLNFCYAKKQPFQIHITYQAHLWKSQEFVITFGKDFFLRIFFFFYAILFCDFKDSMQRDILLVRHG